MVGLDRATLSRATLSKVPEVTLGFWIIKIIATTLGETGGDSLSMSLNLGYALSSLIFIALFVQPWSPPRSRPRPSMPCCIGPSSWPRRQPAPPWPTSPTARSASAIREAPRSCFVLLMASLALWYRVEGSISVDTVATPRREMFYWMTILFSQTLGTALGDWMADTNGLGYGRGALVFGAGAGVVIAALYFFTRTSRTALFWSAFILTRPLGATIGDLLDKPVADGGLAVSRFYASAILAVVIVACILVLPQRAGKHPGAAA
jgi:uncharacterized membrane-anchored protein